MRRAIQCVQIGGLAAVLAMAAGCVASESSGYQRRLDAVMQREDGPRQDVASAFGLKDAKAKTGTMVANAPDQ